jgi:hypothetical protein
MRSASSRFGPSCIRSSNDDRIDGFAVPFACNIHVVNGSKGLLRLAICSLVYSKGQDIICSDKGLQSLAWRWNLAPGNHAGMYFTSRLTYEQQIRNLKIGNPLHVKMFTRYSAGFPARLMLQRVSVKAIGISTTRSTNLATASSAFMTYLSFVSAMVMPYVMSMIVADSALFHSARL